MAEHVIVRFNAALRIPYRDGVWGRLAGLIGEKWQPIARDFGDLRMRRVFDEDRPSQGGTRPAAAVVDPAEHYFDIELPDRARAGKLVRRLRELGADIVDEVYLRGRVTLAEHGVGTPPGFDDVPDGQRYFEPGPIGIDAVGAWNLFQARGKGVTIADVETGWYLEHKALPRGIRVRCGKNASNQDHGAAVMGILVALHTDQEVKGGAPDAQAFAASYVRPRTNDNDVAWAINRARKMLDPGDILLLELAMPYEDRDRAINIPSAPAESKPHIRAAIRRCTEAGILVIEPAGNSGVDLTPLELEARPSGALMVGASNHERGRRHRAEGQRSLSNYGSRVNCFAWGHGIRTLTDHQDGYQYFRRTSGAAAIIAVAAALLQSVARRHLKRIGRTPSYLTPKESRDYLSNPATGTRSVDRVRRPIGVMPKLSHVIEHFLGDFPEPRRRRARTVRHRRPIKHKIQKH